MELKGITGKRLVGEALDFLEFAAVSSDRSSEFEKHAIHVITNKVFNDVFAESCKSLSALDQMAVYVSACNIILSALDGSNESEEKLCLVVRKGLDYAKAQMHALGIPIMFDVKSYGDDISAYGEPIIDE